MAEPPAASSKTYVSRYIKARPKIDGIYSLALYRRPYKQYSPDTKIMVKAKLLIFRKGLLPIIRSGAHITSVVPINRINCGPVISNPISFDGKTVANLANSLLYKIENTIITFTRDK